MFIPRLKCYQDEGSVDEVLLRHVHYRSVKAWISRSRRSRSRGFGEDDPDGVDRSGVRRAVRRGRRACGIVRQRQAKEPGIEEGSQIATGCITSLA